ncbi:MAG TPA: tetratricopeptide repeat protein [Tepidisphaeraceae bacterium]|jgi:tetratricopeptide (TPR) repeat protein
MSMKAKSRKRLIVLFCAAAIVVGGGTGAYVFRKLQVRHLLAHDRAEGLAAVQKKDYPTAVKDLGEYLASRPNDIEVLKAYLKARPMAGGSEVATVRDTIPRLHQLVLFDPSDTDARQQLMDLYWRYGYVPEAEEQAQELLKKNPKDADALKHLLWAKIRNRGEDLTGSKTKGIASGNEIATRWVAAAPDDPEPYFWVLNLAQENGQQADQIVAKARELGQKQPNSPLSELIMAEAYRITNDRASAVQMLKAAAAQPMPSTDFAKMLARQMDVMGLYHNSLQLLQKQSHNGSDPTISEDLAKRQWEAGDAKGAIAQTNGIEDKLSTEGKAIRAISLRAVGKTDEADAIQKELAQQGTPLASAWAVIVHEMAAPQEVTPRQVVDACGAAAKSGAGARDAYLQFFLAQAYERLGERELAADALEKAAAENVTWSLPLVYLSRIELARQHPAEAYQAAIYACQRAQSANAQAAIALAKAWEAYSQENGTGTSGPPKQLMSLVQQMHEKMPDEEQTLAMYVSLLCQSQPSRSEEAKIEINRALSGNTHFTEEGLIRLATLSKIYNLGVTDQTLALSEKKFGMTPALAYAEAVMRYVPGDVAGGKTFLQQAHAKGKGDALQWDMANARYLELVHDPQAGAAWMALGDANPNNLSVQQTILDIPSVQGQTDFLTRTIDRVKKLTGDDAITWKLAQARLTLAGKPDPQKLATTSLELKQILAQAPDLADAYALLGECYQRLGDLSQAINQLQIAQQRNPKNVSLAVYYAQLLAAHQEFDKSRTVLSAIPQASMNADQRREAAQLFAEQGDAQRASDLLASGKTDDVRSELLLAQLDRQQGKTDETAALVTKMLQAPTPQAIAFAADFYASQGKIEQAQKTIAMLGSLKADPGTLAILRSEFAARYESVDKAVADLKEGIAAAPDNAEVWRALVQINFLAGRGDAAKAALAQSSSSVPSDPGLTVLRENADLLAKLSASPQLRIGVMAVVNDPRADNPVLKALKEISDAQQNQLSLAQTTKSLQSLLDQNPHSLALRELVIQGNLELGTATSLNQAVQLSTEGMQMFPADPEPARLAAQSLMVSGRSSEALGYIKIWRDRSAGNPMQADLMMARALMQVGRPADAVQTDKPYIATLLRDPEAASPDIMVYVAGLNATGNYDEAEKIAWPLVLKYPAWRNRWMALAMQCTSEKVTAAWLEKVTPQITKDDPNDLLALASTWHELAVRTQNQAYAEKSKTVFAELAQQNNLPGKTLESMGVFQEQLGDSATAETMYRRAIQAQPDLPIALNNLAMILANRPDKLDESLALAQRAVKAAPQAATIYDTEAFVDAKRHHFDDADAAMQQALKLDAQNRLWYVHRAKYLWEGGKHQEAQSVAAKINEMPVGEDEQSKKAEHEWQTLRGEMNGQANAQ